MGLIVATYSLRLTPKWFLNSSYTHQQGPNFMGIRKILIPKSDMSKLPAGKMCNHWEFCIEFSVGHKIL